MRGVPMNLYNPQRHEVITKWLLDNCAGAVSP